MCEILVENWSHKLRVTNYLVTKLGFQFLEHLEYIPLQIRQNLITMELMSTGRTTTMFKLIIPVSFKNKIQSFFPFISDLFLSELCMCLLGLKQST